MSANLKNELRKQWLAKRKAVTPERRKQASLAIFNAVQDILAEPAPTLSYAPFNCELDVTQVNKVLAQKKRLVLSRIENDELTLFLVEDLDKQLVKGRFGVKEPDPTLCKAISPLKIGTALVPSIAFDAANHRLGYGKGFYDRFLWSYKHSIKTVGVNFSEQFSETPFPIESHDISLDRIILV